VRTVKRAFPAVTIASGAACGLFSAAKAEAEPNHIMQRSSAEIMSLFIVVVKVLFFIIHIV
jgi:hypothetical protein